MIIEKTGHISKTQLFRVMKETARLVDTFIIESLSCFDKENNHLYEAVLHLPLIRAQKRHKESKPKLRASIARLVFELLCDEDWKKIVPLASVCELLAISSYVIDDLIDNQRLRNGFPATWVKHGQATAVICAQLQRELAEKILLSLNTTDLQRLRLLELSNEIFYHGYIGQFLDSQMRHRVSRDYYLQRCEKIAGIFNSNVVKMAAIFGCASKEVFERLAKFGYWHGVALQIRNDLVDYLPSEIITAAGSDSINRIPFEDFRNGKWTLPLLEAYKHANKECREQIELLLKQETLSSSDYRILIEIMLETGAYQSTLDLVSMYKGKALAYLAAFPEKPAKHYLMLLLDSIENGRAYVRMTRDLLESESTVCAGKEKDYE